ncbi:hypothetical protein GFK33_27180, partial [Salmonella enterica subsp. enterica serovar 4,[5],12:i:-]|nr:hypothetical protein [Salmonella enterica subsp. enterica serovar 4,[5],12:i:-]
RALCAAGYTAEHIAYVIEKSPLRYHADRTRPPLSGNALLQDIKRVLALPYTESTGSERDSGTPRTHITPGLFKDYTTLC